jgi:hypothetical protein
LRDIAALLDHRATELDPGDCRERRHPGVDALAYQHFGHADPDRIGFDQDLAVERSRCRYIDIFQH